MVSWACSPVFRVLSPRSAFYPLVPRFIPSFRLLSPRSVFYPLVPSFIPSFRSRHSVPAIPFRRSVPPFRHSASAFYPNRGGHWDLRYCGIGHFSARNCGETNKNWRYCGMARDRGLRDTVLEATVFREKYKKIAILRCLKFVAVHRMM